MGGTGIYRVYMYVRGNSHDQQAAWLNCGKIDVDVVDGNCERSEKCSREGTFIAPESGKNHAKKR